MQKKKNSHKFANGSSSKIINFDQYDDFWGDSFFFKNSIEINLLDIYSVGMIFYNLFEMFDKNVMKYFRLEHPGIKKDDPEYLKMEGYLKYHKTLSDNFAEAFRRGYSLCNGHFDAKIGEFANPRYKSDEKFSLIFPIPRASAVTLINMIDKLFLNDILNKNIPKENDASELSKQLEQYAAIEKPIFKKRIKSFCDFSRINQLFINGEHTKFKEDRRIAIEVRIF